MVVLLWASCVCSARRVIEKEVITKVIVSLFDTTKSESRSSFEESMILN